MKHNKTLRRILSVMLSLIMCLTLLPVSALAEETSTDVEISEANFPDDVFREYVSDEFDTNNDGYLDNDEIKAVTEIDVYEYWVIESLTGIEYFTELEELDCASNKLTTLDISNNTKVKMLDCDNNSLTELKIGQNESLKYLYCSENQLTTLDVSQNPGLIDLYCSENQLTYLDLSKNTINNFSASDNVYEITLNEDRTFDLSTLPGGKFDVNSITTYYIGSGTIDEDKAVLTLKSGVEEFTYKYDCGSYCYADFTLKVKSEDDNTDDNTDGIALTSKNFPDEKFRNFVKDYDLDSSNSLSEEEIANVTEMNLSGKSIFNLKGIEYFTALENLRCDTNLIEELDLSKNTNLNILDCSNNFYLTKLNINNCTKLERVECSNCKLTSLDLSDNTALKTLYCHSNNITELKNIKNTKLERLGCSSNAITELNLDGVLTLKRLYCSNNKLTYLNLSNTNVSDFGCDGNSYTVTIDENREFDLTELPGGNFDVSQASNWAGGEPNGNILKVKENAIEVTYDYNCGNSITGSFTLEIIDPADDENGIEINEENFPDAVFRQYVLDNCDASGNGKLSKKEIADTKSIDFYNSNIKNVSNLKGIENFTALEELNCWKNKLTSIDLSKNTELKTLSCGENYLTVLDLSSNTKLENLYCFYNKLTSLDLSNTNITSSSEFDADGNCAEIFLADNNERTFELSTLSGGKFDVNNVSDLEGGTISGTTLNINENATEVTYNYDCGKDRIVEFTIKVYGQGTVILDSLNFPDENFRNYVYNNIDKNKDGVLSTDEMDAVEEIRCPSRGIADLKGIEYFKNLKTLICDSNELTTLDVSKNTALEYLDCYENQLATLNVSNNKALEILYCNDNELTSLYVSNNTALELLYCYNNELTSLDVSNNTALETLYCDDNELTSLYVSKNEALTSLDCSHNKLTSLNVGSNTKLLYLGCGYNGLTSLDVSNNTALENLYCSGNNLTSLNVDSNTKLAYLGCNENKLEELILNSNTELAFLYCSFNKLTSLDVSNNTKLNELICEYNSLGSLNLSNNAELAFMYCDKNNLTYLDLSSNTKMNDVSCADSRYVLAEGSTTLELPAEFDKDKVSDMNGGSISGNTLTFDEGATKVTYNYKCSDSYTAAFTIYAADYPKNTVTAEGLYGEYKGVKDGETYTYNYYDGETVNLEIGSRDGYALDGLTLNGITEGDITWYKKDEDVSERAISFTMPAKDVKVTVNWASYGTGEEGGGSTDDTNKYTVTASGIYDTHYGNEPGETFTRDYAAEERVSILIGKRDGYKLESLTLVGISKDDITWAAEGVETEARGISFTMPANDVTIAVIWTANGGDDTTKYTVTASGIYHTHYGNEPGETFTLDYAAGESVSLLIGKREGYTLESLTLVGISEKDITWAAEGVETDARSISFTMPENDVTVTVNWASNSGDDTTKYTVTASGFYEGVFGNETGATFTLDYAAGENVSLLIGMREGYTLKNLTLVGISEKDITWNTKEENTQRMIRFTMPANDVTVTVNWTANSSSGGSSGGGGGGGSLSYSVAADKTENGKVTVSPGSAKKGAEVTVTVTPDEGYALETLIIKDKDGKEIEFTDNGDGTFTFTMPSGKVTVETSFKAETPELVEPEETAGAENPFTDVSADAYYYDAVLWAVENGITSGTTETTFEPDASCTRAQILTFLWRAAGSPKATGSNPFTDVSADAYYYDAVLWAVENGITSGTSETTFEPNATVTRGQTVAFMYRMAGSPAADGAGFSDVSSNAYYADAVAWAVDNDITAGTGNGQFSPDADCTRAQIVTFLYRYMG